MKKYLLIPIVLSLVGCFDSNEQLSESESEDIVLPYFKADSYLDKNLPYYTENLTAVSNIKSLSEGHNIEIITEGGAKSDKFQAVTFDHYDYVKIMRSCKIKLKKSDVTNTTSLKDAFLYFKDDNWIISNEEIKKNIGNCAQNYLKTQPIKKDELAYFLADDRIKNNLHYPFLKDSIAKATSDKKITYMEIFDIYRNLDKAIETNLSDDLDKLNAELNNQNGEKK